ncbi:Ribbon-helix-helix protein, copG family [Lachnospiraceae bacterium XPB1003]|nr:Ribbon-helix-helix protein, copG family [Lachnospiraceae bacterium XPB1003]
MADRLVIKKRGDDGYKTFSIRIKNETVDKIDKIASESNLSRNQIIQEMLDFASDKIEIQK